MSMVTMAASVLRRFSVGYFKYPQYGLLVPCTQVLANMEPLSRGKHWKPEFKKLRRKKVMKIELPKFQEDEKEDLSDEKVRRNLKKEGLLPPRPWMERPLIISCTGSIFEPYVPPEGDGKMSLLTGGGAKQSIVRLEKKSKSIMAIRKIRTYDDDFDKSEFCDQAQDLYIKAHTYMAAKDRLKIREVVTERCYPELIYNSRNKTIHWKFLKSLEPPRVVHARCTSVITKDNMFGQITVRFHTQQQLAIYDRFGRLTYGSEILAKDVLEYIVFEKHLSNLYGTWRMHDKIIPDWLPPRDPVRLTFSRSDEPIDVGLSTKGKEAEKTVMEHPPDKTEGKSLAVA